MRAEPPRGVLLRKLLVATLLPAVAVFVAFGALAYEVARGTLEDQLGRRLATAAAGAALLVLPQQVTAIGAGDEGTMTYATLRRRLFSARDQLGVRRVTLVTRDLEGRGDTAGRVALGAKAHEFGADAVEIGRAASGTASASPLFIGRDGIPYKRAYARVGGEDLAGFLAVEGSSDAFASLAALRRWLLLGGAVGLGVVVLFAVLVARRITGPVGRLAAAAHRIGRGELDGPVAVETRDEVGHLAARLDEMRAALQARDERTRMMLAGIAHEVRNPLGGLALYAGLLREGLADRPEALAQVARVEREVRHLEAVVADFLEYARRPPPEKAPFDVRTLLEEVVEVCGAGGAGPAISVDAPAGLLARGDRGQVRRALANLARNAVAAAGPGGRVVLAARAAATEARPGSVEWEVRDSGPGVADDLRDKVFAPFFTTREKGTGLGLAFVREIVRDHGGDVSVDRAAEGGARFRFVL